jgi:hypothetical protein
MVIPKGKYVVFVKLSICRGQHLFSAVSLQKGTGKYQSV